MNSIAETSSRRNDLDALRGSAMILGIIYHGALSLALGFLWFVQDPSANKPIYVFQSWVHGFRMPLFFIISGFFTAMLWKKRGTRALIVHRFRRILLPCILGSVTLVPLCNLVMGYATAEGQKRRVRAAMNASPESDIWAAIRHRRADAVKMHLDKGFEWTDVHPEYRTTVLSWAAIVGDIESVKLLIDRGCDPSIPNPDANTPLHAAMFLGRYDVAEYLLEQGADRTKKNNTGETPIDSLRGDISFVNVLAWIFLMEINLDDVRNGRSLIASKLLNQNESKPNTTEPKSDKSMADQLGAMGGFFRFYPVFSYLWFLWFLWWYAVGFAFLTWSFKSISSTWPPIAVRWFMQNLCSPLAMIFWIAIALIPIRRMNSLGFLFGPDTSVSLIPDPHVFAYYAIFFLFGVCYYLTGDNQAKLGGTWRWLFPLSLFVVFPIALEINLGTFGFRNLWIPNQWIRPLSVLSQSIFAWWMSLACIGLFRSCMNEQRPWIRYLSDSSYWLYVAHLPLVVFLQTKIAESPLNGFLKLLIISTLCIALLLVSYQLFVRRSWIGRLLNGSRTKPLD